MIINLITYKLIHTVFAKKDHHIALSHFLFLNFSEIISIKIFISLYPIQTSLFTFKPAISFDRSYNKNRLSTCAEQITEQNRHSL